MIPNQGAPNNYNIQPQTAATYNVKPVDTYQAQPVVPAPAPAPYPGQAAPVVTAPVQAAPVIGAPVQPQPVAPVPIQSQSGPYPAQPQVNVIYAGQPQPIGFVPAPLPPTATEITPEIQRMLGLGNCIRGLAIAELVCYCITIIGLVFIYFPISAMKGILNFDLEVMKCYRVWRYIVFVCGLISIIMNLLNEYTSVYTYVSAAIAVLFQTYWLYTYEKYFVILRSLPPQTRDALKNNQVRDSTCLLW